MEGGYEHQLKQLYDQLDEEQRHTQKVELENQQLRAQLQALHRRQFKGRKSGAVPVPECSRVERFFLHLTAPILTSLLLPWAPASE